MEVLKGVYYPKAKESERTSIHPHFYITDPRESIWREASVRARFLKEKLIEARRRKERWVLLQNNPWDWG